MSVQSLEFSPGYRFSNRLVWLCLCVGVCLVAAFWEGLQTMAITWFSTEEYSHGVLIPLIAGFLVWQRRSELARAQFVPSWSGVAVVLMGAALNLIGKLAAIYVLQQYAFMIVLCGLVLTVGGWRMLRELWAPLFLLLFMIPLPNFFFNSLSLQLQLISSQIGVWFIRLFGISVFVEGNVIDLGAMKLQVAEACSGLRYLFPLITLGFIAAYFFKVSLWKRVVLFLSSIPITVLMNSLRIGAIGVLVEHWGAGMAEGFLHDFEGWVVFMFSAALLFAEMILLARIGKAGRSWREVFGVEMPREKPREAAWTERHIPAAFVTAGTMLALVAFAFVLIPRQAEVIPRRQNFATFPAHIGVWQGRQDRLEQVYLDTLKLDDYLMANYAAPQHGLVNFYVAWYDSQKAGQSAHSPRSCLPGGGWRIADLRQRTVEGVLIDQQPLQVNRALIESGADKQIVYYWFQQRGRIVTNEYLVKWYLFWDSLREHRTDGALVRLIAPLRPGQSEAEVDSQLRSFAAAVTPTLQRYIPG